MILIDSNLLIYAQIRAFSQHQMARLWLDDRLSGPMRVGFPWASLLSFVRIVTSPRILERPLSIEAAWQQVDAWLDSANAWIPQPTERHRGILKSLLIAPGIQSSLVPDAHLAALAIEHGLSLCSADSDFARFPGLSWENPFAA